MAAVRLPKSRDKNRYRQKAIWYPTFVRMLALGTAYESGTSISESWT
jgi:hypothetical protein